MQEASERTQLIVTTHSDVLVATMTDQPEAVIICEKGENGTSLQRLDAANLKPWLAKYRLGELWTRGDIGGTRGCIYAAARETIGRNQRALMKPTAT
jgi:hypothetical protein